MTSYRQSRVTAMFQYTIVLTTVRTYLIRWRNRSGRGRRGACGMKPISTDGSAASPFMRRSACRDWPPSTSMDGARMHTRTGRLRSRLPYAVVAEFVRESMARPVIDCGSLRSVDTYGHHSLRTARTRRRPSADVGSVKAAYGPTSPGHSSPHRVGRVRLGRHTGRVR